MGTFALTTLAVMALKHLLHSFYEIQLGRYEALTLMTTEPPKLTAPLDESWTWSGMNFLHLLGALDDPPVQVHPCSSWHVLEHPSPLTLFPSSHCCSYLIPSPQISSQLTIFCPESDWLSVLYPNAHVLHSKMLSHSIQLSKHFEHCPLSRKKPKSQGEFFEQNPSWRTRETSEQAEHWLASGPLHWLQLLWHGVQRSLFPK